MKKTIQNVLKYQIKIKITWPVVCRPGNGEKIGSRETDEKWTS